MIYLISGFDSSNCQWCSETEYDENRLPTCDKGDSLFVADSQSLVNELLFLGYKAKLLSQYNGFSNFYEMYSWWFGDTVDTMKEVLTTLYNGIVTLKSQSVFVLKVGVFFTWFSTDTTTLKVAGSLQFSKTMTLPNVGQFVKKLRRTIVDTGYRVDDIKYLYWSEQDIDKIFDRYFTSYTILNKDYKDLYNYKDAYMMLTKEYTKSNITAEMFIKALFKNRQGLGFVLDKSGNAVWRTPLSTMNYSEISIMTDIAEPLQGVGAVIDCEGETGGNTTFRECGIVMFKEYKSFIISSKTILCQPQLSAETFTALFEQLKDLATKSCKRFPLYMFGVLDKQMIIGTIQKYGGDNAINILKLFEFIDVRNLMSTRYNYEGSVPSLNSVAEGMGVTVCKPSHNGLADAKTLFNILAGYKRKGYSVYTKLGGL